MEVSLHQKNTIGQMNLEEMLELNKYLASRIKEKLTEKGLAIKSSLGYGDKVSFVNSKTGVRLHGEIVKVMRKYAKVNVPGGPVRSLQWRVPLSMICKE